MKPTQDELNATHEEVMHYIQLYVSELITLPEFARAVSGAVEPKGVRMDEEALLDLVDPATGLRFI